MTIAQQIVDQSYWSKAPEIRFVERGGKRILQYLQIRNYKYHQEGVWVDVPLSEET